MTSKDVWLGCNWPRCQKPGTEVRWNGGSPLNLCPEHAAEFDRRVKAIPRTQRQKR